MASKAARSSRWAMVESVGLSGLSLITFIVLARLVGPAEFGIAALALGVVQLLEMLVGSLFGDAIVQRRDLEPAHLDSAFWASLAIAVALWLGCVAAAEPLAQSFAEPALAGVLGWMALSIIFGGVSGVLVAEYRRALNLRPVALRSLAGRLAGAALGIGLAFAGYGVWSLVVQHVAASACALLVVWISLPRRPALRFSLRHLKALLGFAAPSFLGQFIIVCNLRAFTLVAGWILGATALGYFSIAIRIVDTSKAIVATAANQVALPWFSARQDDPAGLRQAFHTATQFTCFVTLPLFAGLAVCAPELVQLLLGSRWAPAVPLVQILAVAATISFVRMYPAVVCSAMGRPVLNLLPAALAMVLSLGGLAVIPHDAEAVTLLWVARLLVMVPIGFVLVRRLLGLGPLAQLRGAAGPLAAAALMAGVLLLVKPALPADWPAAAVLSGLVPLGGVIYLAVALALMPQMLGRTLQIALPGRRPQE